MHIQFIYGSFLALIRRKHRCATLITRINILKPKCAMSAAEEVQLAANAVHAACDSTASALFSARSEKSGFVVLRRAQWKSRASLISWCGGFNFSLFQLQIHFLPAKCALFIHQTPLPSWYGTEKHITTANVRCVLKIITSHSLAKVRDVFWTFYAIGFWNNATLHPHPVWWYSQDIILYIIYVASNLIPV